MDVAVFSDDTKVIKLFETIKRSKNYTLQQHEAKSLKKTIKNVVHMSIIYIDINSYKVTEQRGILNYLAKLDNYCYGIIDLKNSINDKAELFFNGTADYIGKEFTGTKLTAKRMEKLLTFRPVSEEKLLITASNHKNNYIISGDNWKSISSGKEYTFTMMYVELENYHDLITETGSDHTDKFIKAFQNLLSQFFMPCHGKIWIWRDYSGVLLFPFNGRHCNVILQAFKFVLNRRLLSVEAYNFKMLLKCKIVLHIGNTVYKSRGNTGKIISDSINSIFHIGQKFAQKENVLLTENIVPFIPREIKKFFLSYGEFENRNIYKMKMPV